MKLSQSTLSLIEETIKKAIAKFACGCEQTIVTDIHLQPVQSSGDLLIFDDDDNELAHATVEEWMTYEGDDFYENVERIFANMLGNMKKEGAFDKHDGKYLAEFDMGYNGTENFAKGRRFGFFPSGSAGWVVTDEKFIPKNDVLTL